MLSWQWWSVWWYQVSEDEQLADLEEVREILSCPGVRALLQVNMIIIMTMMIIIRFLKDGGGLPFLIQQRPPPQKLTIWRDGWMDLTKMSNNIFNLFSLFLGQSSFCAGTWRGCSRSVRWGGSSSDSTLKVPPFYSQPLSQSISIHLKLMFPIYTIISLFRQIFFSYQQSLFLSSKNKSSTPFSLAVSTWQLVKMMLRVPTVNAPLWVFLQFYSLYL